MLLVALHKAFCCLLLLLYSSLVDHFRLVRKMMFCNEDVVCTKSIPKYICYLYPYICIYTCYRSSVVLIYYDFQYDYYDIVRILRLLLGTWITIIEYTEYGILETLSKFCKLIFPLCKIDVNRTTCVILDLNSYGLSI